MFPIFDSSLTGTQENERIISSQSNRDLQNLLTQDNFVDDQENITRTEITLGHSATIFSRANGIFFACLKNISHRYFRSDHQLWHFMRNVRMTKWKNASDKNDFMTRTHF